MDKPIGVQPEQKNTALKQSIKYFKLRINWADI